MAADSDKMTALKKAYADVILNTVNESAARILAAERRAIRFQRSLIAAKEEGVATLMRLKTLMDSKIKEAEATSLSQVTRIKELEAHLSEAESTIISLREELERVDSQVKKIKGESVEPSDKQNTEKDSDSDMSAEPTLMNKDSVCCFSRNSIHGESLKDLSNEKERGSSPDLASIIMRSKEPELYRNGCTQRIRAFEHNVRTVKVTHGQSDIPDRMKECKLSDSRKKGWPQIVNATTAKLVTKEEKKPTKSEGYDLAFLSVTLPRKPRTKCIQIKSLGFPSCHDQDNSVAVYTEKLVSDGPPHKLPKLHSAPVSVSCTGVEDRRHSLKKTFSNEHFGLSSCNNRAVTQLNCQNEISQTSPHKTEEYNKHRDGIKAIISSSTSEIDDSKLALADENTAENIDNSDLEDAILVLNSNPKVETDSESCRPLPQAGKENILKYTFQRKRKRGPAVSMDESILIEKTTADSKSDDKQNFSVEPPKSVFVTDLPQNDRQLMLVARQLISLSEKEW